MPKEKEAVLYPTIETVEDIAKKARAEWFKENVESSGRIRDWVFANLEKSKKEILHKLLGFDRKSFGSSGEWELDHCNGRAGESSAGDYLKEKVAEAIREWLESFKAGIPAPSKQLKREVREEFQRMYKSEIMRVTRSLAVERAEQDALELMETLSDSVLSTPINEIKEEVNRYNDLQ
jgi:hypothetical protein